jgi:hypothetical protein
VTKKGQACLAWNATGFKHKYMRNAKRDDLRENFCRNPAKSGRTIWCYTGKKGRRRMWGYCNAVDP